MDLTPMPIAVIISENNYTYINNKNFIKENVDSTVEKYLKSNTGKIIIEYLYRDQTTGFNQTKKIVEDIASNYSERVSIQKYKLETYLPIVIIRDQNYENFKKFEHNSITKDNLINTIEKFKAAEKNNKNNDNGFSIPSFETYLFFLSISLFVFVFLRKKYKRN